ncbi:MAG: PIN domain-containing protein [Planctomycetota bacterium]
MNEWFADTSYYVALLNRSDAHHARATALTGRLRGHFVTTEWVLLELANTFCAPPDRPRVVSLIDGLRTKRNVATFPSTPELFVRGFSLYRERIDKRWSLTDCISFVLMDELRLREALSSDHHFEQAGFAALLRR